MIVFDEFDVPRVVGCVSFRCVYIYRDRWMSVWYRSGIHPGWRRASHDNSKKQAFAIIRIDQGRSTHPILPTRHTPSQFDRHLNPSWNSSFSSCFDAILHARIHITNRIGHRPTAHSLPSPPADLPLCLSLSLALSALCVLLFVTST